MSTEHPPPPQATPPSSTSPDHTAHLTSDGEATPRMCGSTRSQAHNGRGNATGKPTRPRKRPNDEWDGTVVMESRHPWIPDGDYDLKCVDYEKWPFKGNPEAMKLSLWFEVFDGPHNGTKVAFMCNFKPKFSPSSKLWDVIVLANGGAAPQRPERVSLRTLLVGRLFRGVVQTVTRNGPDGKSADGFKYSVVQRLKESLT